jgi:hypothetical protein
MDLRYYWIRDRVRHNQFPIYSDAPVVAVQSHSDSTTTDGAVATMTATSTATTVPHSGNLDLSGGSGKSGRPFQNRHFRYVGQTPQRSSNAASHHYRIQIKYKKKM